MLVIAWIGITIGFFAATALLAWCLLWVVTFNDRWKIDLGSGERYVSLWRWLWGDID